jgi:hypothetical protein
MRAAGHRGAPHLLRGASPLLLAACGLILALALALRLAGADGELWLDEIWSLHLIDEVRGGESVFAIIPSDNNHYLNTLWLWIVGPDGSPLAYRALSVALGTGTVALAGWMQRERGAVAILTAMALFAATYLMVNYGSEARGYAGLMFCGLAAIAAAERAIAVPSSGSRFRLGLAVFAGVLFQPIMLGLVAALGLWSVWLSWQRTRSLRQTTAATRDLWAWTIRLMILFVALIGFAMWRSGGYFLGGYQAFSALEFTNGIGNATRFLLGLPTDLPWPAAIAVLAALLILAAMVKGRTDDPRFALYLTIILLIPLAMLIARPPNTGNARYYLMPACAVLLLISDTAGLLSRRGPPAKVLAVVLVAAVLGANAVQLAHFYASGRGAVTRYLPLVAAEGSALVSSNTEARDRPVIRYYAAKLGLPVTYVDLETICDTRPRWLLTSDLSEIPEVATIGAPACSLTYRQVQRFRLWGLSGFPWALYRAEE